MGTPINCVVTIARDVTVNQTKNNEKRTACSSNEGDLPLTDISGSERSLLEKSLTAGTVLPFEVSWVIVRKRSETREDHGGSSSERRASKVWRQLLFLAIIIPANSVVSKGHN